MPTVENISDQTRVWPAIQTTAGVTLELDPGETAEVDGLPEDPYLQVAAPVASEKSAGKATNPKADEKEPQP